MILDDSVIEFDGSYEVAFIRNIISEQLLDAVKGFFSCPFAKSIRADVRWAYPTFYVSRYLQ